jgi:hypothetical protein
VNQSETEAKFRLDLKRFPRRIDLELNEEVIQAVERMAAASGRSFSEVVVDLLSRNASKHYRQRNQAD